MQAFYIFNNNNMKKYVYTLVALAFSIQSNLLTFAASSETTFWLSKASTTAGGLESRSLSEAVQSYVNYLMTFLYLIAVLYALWGWFQILTAWWEEDKVKKGKTILVQWGLWLLVIWLAWTIVKWVLSVLVA